MTAKHSQRHLKPSCKPTLFHWMGKGQKWRNVRLCLRNFRRSFPVTGRRSSLKCVHNMLAVSIFWPYLTLVSCKNDCMNEVFNYCIHDWHNFCYLFRQPISVGVSQQKSSSNLGQASRDGRIWLPTAKNFFRTGHHLDLRTISWTANWYRHWWNPRNGEDFTSENVKGRAEGSLPRADLRLARCSVTTMDLLSRPVRATKHTRAPLRVRLDTCSFTQIKKGQSMCIVAH